MVLWRSILFWTSWALMALLIVLCIIGAFLGAADAKRLFNSIPMAVFWGLLAVSLLMAFMSLPRLLRRPGSLAMHAGTFVILLGAMWGSDSGHRLVAKLGGTYKVPSAYMVIHKDQSTKELLGPDMQSIGQLPFSVQLRDLVIEYYPAAGTQWRLVAQPLRPQAGATLYPQWPIDWRVGQAVVVPNTFCRLTVLEFLDSGRAIYPTTQPQVSAIGAVADPTTGTPVMKLRVRRGDGASVEFYLAPKPGVGKAYMPLSYLLGEPKDTRDDIGLWLLPPATAVKGYRSEVSIIQGGRVVRKDAIEVNHPMHYGGYYLCQNSYDQQEQKYTMLLVASDSGLGLVYAGLALLVLGAAWHGWFGPLRQFLRGRPHGD